MSVGAFPFDTYKSPPVNIRAPICVKRDNDIFIFTLGGNYDMFMLSTGPILKTSPFTDTLLTIPNLINGKTYDQLSDEYYANITEDPDFPRFSLSINSLFLFTNTSTDNLYFTPVNYFNGKYTLGESLQIIPITLDLSAPGFITTVVPGSFEIYDSNGDLFPLNNLSYQLKNYVSAFDGQSYGEYTRLMFPARPIVSVNTGEFNVPQITTPNIIRTIRLYLKDSYYYDLLVFDSIAKYNQYLGLSGLTTLPTDGVVAYSYIDNYGRYQTQQLDNLIFPTTVYYMAYRTRIVNSVVTYETYRIYRPTNEFIITIRGELIVTPYIPFDKYIIVSNLTELNEKCTGKLSINVPNLSSLITTSETLENDVVVSSNPIYAIPYTSQESDIGTLISFANSYITLNRNTSIINGYFGTPVVDNIRFDRANLTITDFDYRIYPTVSELIAGDVIYVYESLQGPNIATYTLQTSGTQTCSIPLPNLGMNRPYDLKIKLKSQLSGVKYLTIPSFNTLNGLQIPLNALTLNSNGRGIINVILDKSLILFEGQQLDTTKRLRLRFLTSIFDMTYDSISNTYTYTITGLPANTIFSNFSFDYAYDTNVFSNIVALVKSVRTRIETTEVVFGTVNTTFSNLATILTISGFDYLDIANTSLPTTTGGTLTLKNNSTTYGVKSLIPGKYPADVVFTIYDFTYDTTYGDLYIQYNSKSLTIPVSSFKTPKLFEVTPIIQPLIHKVLITIPETSKFYGNTFSKKIKLELDSSTAAEVNFPDSGPYTHLFNASPNTTYTPKLYYNYQNAIYSDAHILGTITTLSDTLTATQTINISADTDGKTIVNITLTDITSGVLVSDGKIYRSDNQQFVPGTNGAINFPTLTNLDPTAVYKYTVKYRPQISITTGVEDYTNDYVLKPFRAIAGLAYTIDSLTMNGLTITVKIKDILLDGAGIPDGTILKVYLLGVGSVASTTTQNFTATFSFNVSDPVDYLKPSFIVNTDPWSTIYDPANAYLPDIYSPVSGNISAPAQSGYAIFDFSDLTWYFGTVEPDPYTGYSEIDGKFVIGTINKLPNPTDFDTSIPSFSFPLSKTVTGRLDISDPLATYTVIPIYDINTNEWQWVTLITTNTGVSARPVFTNTSPPQVASGDGSLPSMPGYPGPMYYIYREYIRFSSETVLTITDIKIADIQPPDGTRIKVVNEDGTDLIGPDPDGLTTNYNINTDEYIFLNGAATITLPFIIDTYGKYKLKISYENLALSIPYMYTHNTVDIPQTGQINYPPVLPMNAPLALRSNDGSIKILKFPDRSPFYYITDGNPSFGDSMFDIRIKPETLNISSRLSRVESRITRSLLVRSPLNTIYSVSVNKNQGWAAFGDHYQVTVGNLLKDSPGYLIQNINVPNTFLLGSGVSSNDLISGETKDVITFEYVSSTNFSISSDKKTLQLNPISYNTIIHDVTGVNVKALTRSNNVTSDDLLHIYTTSVKEFPYRPKLQRLKNDKYRKTTNSISLIDTNISTLYPKFLVFDTLQKASQYVNTLKIDPIVTTSLFTSSNPTTTQAIPDTLYLLPYSTDTYGTQTLVSYASAPLQLNALGNSRTVYLRDASQWTPEALKRRLGR